MENYLTYLGFDKYRDNYGIPYTDDGFSESFRKWVNQDFSEEVKKWVNGEAKSENYKIEEKPKETVDVYGNKLNEKGEICW